jgi:tetratricopeptide (TPR) repeat protein
MIFDTADKVPSMPSKPTPASLAVAQLLRDRRQELGLTLRGVQELSREAGNLIPHSTLARIEAGRFDPGVRRLRQLLELYQLPIQAAGEVLDLEALSGPTPIERNPDKLRDRALDAWRGGRIAEALACFLSFRRRVPNDDEHRTMRQEAVLTFAVASASLGKLHLSRYMLDELLLDKPERDLLLRILIQQSVVWRALGSPVAARAFIERAAALVPPDAPKYRGWIEHQLGLVLMEEGEFAQATVRLERAVQLHRRARSFHDEVLALLGIARLRFEEARVRDALTAARQAARRATKHKFNRLRLSAMVDQAHALQSLDSIDESKTILRAVLADSMVRDDNVMNFFAHFYLWRAELGLGNADRAAIELREAAYFLKYVDQTSREATAVRDELSRRPDSSRRSAGRRSAH